MKNGKQVVPVFPSLMLGKMLNVDDASFTFPTGKLLNAANLPDAPFPEAWSKAAPVAIVIDGVGCFTPTELGRRRGISAQKFNKLLEGRGLQTKRDGQWCLTPAGEAFGVLLQVHKKQLSGTDVQQLKWKESVLSQLDHLT